MSKGYEKGLPQAFNPEKSFFSLGVVRAAFAVAGCLIFLSVIAIYFNGNFSTNFTFEGWNNLFTYFKFPIWIAAALIPVITVLAVNHKSHQHMHAMELTRGQNNFSNYYRHLEEFLKYVEDKVPDGAIEPDHRRIHDLLFPNALQEGIHLNEKLIDEFAGRLDTFLSSIAPNTSEAVGLIFHPNGVRILVRPAYVSLDEFLKQTLSLLDRRILFDKTAVRTDRWTYNRLGQLSRLSEYHQEMEMLRLATDYLTRVVSFDTKYNSPLIELADRFSNIIFEGNSTKRNLLAKYEPIPEGD